MTSQNLVDKQDISAIGQVIGNWSETLDAKYWSRKSKDSGHTEVGRETGQFKIFWPNCTHHNLIRYTPKFDRPNLIGYLDIPKFGQETGHDKIWSTNCILKCVR